MRHIIPRIGGQDAPEALADEASKACSGQERQLADVGIGFYGGDWRPQVVELGRLYRADLIELVNMHRRGDAPTEPIGAWGFCLGKALATTSAEQTDEARADTAFGACKESEAKVLALYQTQNGNEAALRNLEVYRSALRKAMIAEIDSQPRAHSP